MLLIQGWLAFEEVGGNNSKLSYVFHEKETSKKTPRMTDLFCCVVSNLSRVGPLPNSRELPKMEHVWLRTAGRPLCKKPIHYAPTHYGCFWQICLYQAFRQLIVRQKDDGNQKLGLLLSEVGRKIKDKRIASASVLKTHWNADTEHAVFPDIDWVTGFPVLSTVVSDLWGQHVK